MAIPLNIDTYRHFSSVFREAFDRGGFREAWDVFMRGLYRRIRGRMRVQTHATYNNVAVGIERKALDEFVPLRWLPVDSRDILTYESGLVMGLRDQVRPDDRIVVVGGGWGVTTVVAARATGKGGSVTTFEELSQSVDKVRWTVDNARCSDIVTVVHGRVEGRLPDSTPTETIPFKPEELPECDVLELDCEGAELGILERMVIRPRVILVETHGMLGSSTGEVRDALGRIGYSIVSEEIAELHTPAFCRENDVMVLVAVGVTADTSQEIFIDTSPR
jgi:hypothetical protein